MPTGVAPDMARAIADALGVALTLIPYAKPNLLADAAGTAAWDIGLIGAEPARAEKIAFSPAYVEIEATYLLPPGSAFGDVAAVDSAGTRIAVTAGSAYDLWLGRNLRHATLVRSTPGRTAWEMFVQDGLEAYAGLRPGLISDVAKLAQPA